MRLSRVDQELVEHIHSMLEGPDANPSAFCHWGQEALLDIPESLRSEECGACAACCEARLRSQESWQAICEAVCDRLADEPRSHPHASNDRTMKSFQLVLGNKCHSSIVGALN